MNKETPQRNLVRKMITKAKGKHYQGQIEANEGKPKELWNCTRKLTGSKCRSYPSTMTDMNDNLFENNVKFQAHFI